MPKVHKVNRAGKDYPAIGVKKGEPYYWWEFRYGGKRMSKTPPRPSQLTQSKMSGVYAAQEGLKDALAAASDPDDITSAIDQAVGELEDVASEYEDSLSNMPDSLQQSSSGEAIQEKIDAIREYAGELESAKSEVEGLDLSDYEASAENGGRDIAKFSQLSETGQADYLEAARELVSAVEFNEP